MICKIYLEFFWYLYVGRDVLEATADQIQHRVRVERLERILEAEHLIPHRSTFIRIKHTFYNCSRAAVIY